MGYVDLQSMHHPLNLLAGISKQSKPHLFPYLQLVYFLR